MISDRVVASLVAYATGRQGAEDVAGRLARHGLEGAVAAPTGGWVDGVALQRVSAALATPDQTATDLCREAGFAALRLEPMGALAKLADFLDEPGLGFGLLTSLLPLFVQGATVSVARGEAGAAEVVVLLPPLAEPEGLVAFGAGLLEALPTFWGGPGGQCEVSVGAAEGGRRRVGFSVSWPPGEETGPTDSEATAPAAGVVGGVRDGLQGSWLQVDETGSIVGLGGSLGAPLGLVGGAVGRRLVEVAPVWQQAPLAGLIEAARSGRADHVTLDVDGDGSYLRVRTHPLDRGDATRHAAFIGTISDWTAARARHEALVRTSHLAVLGRLAGAISHSYSNSLTGILGYADLGREAAEPAMSQRALRMIFDTASEARNVVGLLRRFADGPLFEEVVGGEHGAVDLAVVTRQVLDLAAVDRRWSQVEILAPLTTLPRVRGSEAAYRHLVVGLIEAALPAIEASSGGVSVAAEAGHHTVSLTIEARTGPGAARAGVWSDADDVTLAACRSLADELGGALEVQHPSTAVSLAILTCPVADPAATATDAPATPASGGGQPLEVLVVDDEAVIRTLLVDIITHAGHIASGAAHGGEAWKLLLQRHYDVVLCDVLMPVMNGLELFARIATMDPRPIVVAMTGRTTREMEDAILQHPVAAILPKPFPMSDVSELLTRLARAKDEPAS